MKGTNTVSKAIGAKWESMMVNYHQNFSKLIKNSLWLLTSEILGKGSRLLTIIVLAATLTPSIYGTGMLALACHDILRLLLRSGAGNQVINCSEKTLVVIAKNAMSLQWIMCISLMVLQLGMAQLSSYFFDNSELATLLTIMAFSYLFFPIVSVRVFLLQRTNNMAFVGLCNGLCLLIENISIAALVYITEDVMAIAYGKIIFAFAWLVLFSFAPIKDYGIGFEWPVIKTLMSSSSKIIFAESAKALHQHMDVFFAAKLLSPESFGIYTFAKSVGIGLSQSLIGAFNNALYPQLCTFHRNGELKQRTATIYLLAFVLASVFVLQAVAATFYIPLFFDPSWSVAIPVTSILCLCACAYVFVDVKTNTLRALKYYSMENYLRILILITSVIGLFVFQPTTTITLAYCMFGFSLLTLIVFLPFKGFYKQFEFAVKRT